MHGADWSTWGPDSNVGRDDGKDGGGAPALAGPPAAVQPPREFADLASWRKDPKAGVALRKHVVTAKAEEGGDLVLTMSTPDEDRDRDVIDQAGWDLANYLANPVVLWAHDYSQLPVARSKRTWVENGKALKIIPQFPTREQYALGATVGELFRGGFINAGSVGFMPIEYSFNEERGDWAIDFKRQELLECSLVPVPANPFALREAKAAGICVEPIAEWAEQMLGAIHGKGIWVSRDTLEKALRAVVPAKIFSLPAEPQPAAAVAPAAVEPPLVVVPVALSFDPARLAAEVGKSFGEHADELLGLTAP